MKKLFVHLSILCLLAVLLVPMVGCKKDEGDVDGTTSETLTSEPTTTEPMMTDTPMTTDTGMGTDTMTSEPMTTDTPPAQ